MPEKLLVSVSMLFMALFAPAQDFDKKAFCASLKHAFTAFESSDDSLKGDYAGVNSLGIEQWKAKISLPDAVEGIYEYSSYLSPEYRATYLMRKNADADEAAELYKKIVSAVRQCYGMDFLLEEKISTEYRGGKKVEQLEAVFTRSIASSSGYQTPYIRVSSTAYETGSDFEVLVELVKPLE